MSPGVGRVEDPGGEVMGVELVGDLVGMFDE
jgi:hypothetical protein